MAISIRLASAADAEAIRQIYNTEVLDSTVTFDLVARTPEEQTAWMSEHDGVYPVVIAENEEGVVGSIPTEGSQGGVAQLVRAHGS